MIKKTLYFGNPAYLHLQENQLTVDFKQKDKPAKTIPIEDIGLVMIDHQQITVSIGLVNSLIANNAAILCCDQKHLPNGLVLPMEANDIFTQKLSFQLSTSQPLKKQLWRQTVQRKIKNQASLLQKLGFDTNNMIHWANKTASGDPENMEGRAAAYYWDCLFNHLDQSGTTRHRYGDPPNHMLNYGYAILRAIIARSLVASGCLPAIGIHHRNKYNAFCLADDIMEPYRPFVDKLVIEWCTSHVGDIPEELDLEMKAYLLNIPVLDITIDNQSSPLMVGAHRTTSSLMKCFEGMKKKIIYPEL